MLYDDCEMIGSGVRIMRSKLIVFVFALVAITALLSEQLTDIQTETISVTMVDTAGNEVGVVVLQPVPNERVLITANIWSLTAGYHGFHIHETGHCEVSSDGDFVSAGGHFDMDDAQHSQHSGDLPVLLADDTGRAFLAVHTANFHLHDLFDEDGSSLIIHAGADNFANIPERYGTVDATTLANGDSGTRVACGVIAAPR